MADIDDLRNEIMEKYSKIMADEFLKKVDELKYMPEIEIKNEFDGIFNRSNNNTTSD